MAIATARVLVNGTWYNLTNQAGKWTGSVTAPSNTSFNLSGGYYPVSVEATNEAGTKTTVTSTDPAVGTSLRLTVNERIKPVAVITSPTAGAYIANNQAPISFTLRDETGGSGVKLDTLSVQLDALTLTSTSPGMVTTPVSGGYDVTYTPQTALTDGAHTVTVSVSDNDGNPSVATAVTYKVDTVPPTLNIASPADGLITSTAAQTIVGTTNDATSSPVVVTVSLNGTDQGAVSVSADGSFAKGITLAVGNNTIVVTSTDKAGKKTASTRHATLDTTSPVISAVTITPNPADAGATLSISVTIA